MAKIGEMITTDEAQEIIKTVESASDGYWFPLVTVASCFSVVIALLLYIWNQTQKNNEKRHVAHEEIISDLAKSKHTNDLILQRLEMLVESHDDKIKQLES